MAEEPKHPTNLLVEDINRFVQDIESLRTTLPLQIQLSNILRRRAARQYHDFLEKMADVKDTSGDVTTYTITGHHIPEFSRLRRTHDSLQSGFRLIPRHFLISLVSQYDWFLGRVIRFLFAIKPEILNASDRQMSFTDLVRFHSLDDAREFIIEKEVESVIRRSHLDQFAWLKDKLKTPFTQDLACLPVFVELTERRNLFVHADGVVSSQYLTACHENNCALRANLKVGDQLEVGKDYFEDAYRCILEIAVKMAHVVWRKLCPARLKESDSNVIAVTFDLIEQREYAPARRILEFFTQTSVKHGDDSNRRTMLLNLAQACKWSDDVEACNKILGLHDWSACEDKYKLGVAALRGDFEGCYALMRRLQRDESFPKSVYANWPIFQELRKQVGFIATYQQCYNEPFALTPTTEGITELTEVPPPSPESPISLANTVIPKTLPTAPAN
jgi:hypothetical protein